MKICLISSGDYFSSYGGGQVYVKSLGLGLKSVSVDLDIISITLDGKTLIPEIKQRELDGIRIWSISLPPNFLKGSVPIELSEEVCQILGKVVRAIKPDLIHAHGWKATAAIVGNQLTIPCIVTAHHGGIVCPNGMLMNVQNRPCNLPVSDQNCLGCAMSFVPAGRFWRPIIKYVPLTLRIGIGRLLGTIGNIPYFSPAWRVSLGIGNKSTQIEVLRRLSRRVVAPSHSIARALERNGIPVEKISVIPHGIKLLNPQPILPGLPRRPLRLGYIGRISYVKGLHIVLSALQTMADPQAIEFHVFGEAATKAECGYLAELKRQSTGLSVFWHGKLGHEQIEPAYAMVDIVLLPSIYTEVFGLTLLEALSVGRPVIASRCGGPEDIVADGINGILVPVDDPVALASAIQYFLDFPIRVQEMSMQIGPVNPLASHVAELVKLYQLELRCQNLYLKNN